MSTVKRILSVFLVLAMILSVTGAMAGCQGGETPSTTGASGPSSNGEKVNYTVSLKTKGGMALSGIAVYVYTDNTLADLEQYGETNAEGTVSFQMSQSEKYAVVLSGVPKGYDVADSYGFSGTQAEIVLTSAPIQGESLSGASLGVGDVMCDFTVTTPDGTTLTLSQVLQEKKMVLLNFWYTTCTWCVKEFPYMEQAYQMYKDDVQVIAVDPFDDEAAIQSFQSSMELTFPMAQCNASWADAFSVQGYPTSVFIDRYGVICLIESGGIVSLNPFTSVFSHFTAEDYQQKLCQSVNDLIAVTTPTQTMPASEDIGAAINSGDISVTYHAEEGEEADLTWPFVLGEKNGEQVLMSSNKGVDNSYAILYADVELKAGQAIGFDYIVSTEKSLDNMVVIVDKEDVYSISGVPETEEWTSCYPWVAEKDGTYELALCYLKDPSNSDGEDTVYIKNMRVVDAGDIDTVSYIPRKAATTEDGFTYSYVQTVLNEKDGYYHVGTADGPLLLANLMGYTPFNEEQSVWDNVYENGFTVDGVDNYKAMEAYCGHASNSAMNGYCTVNEELGELLKAYDRMAGFDDADENEWLRLCSYYQAYGPGADQLIDPIKGLTPASAYEAKLGTNVETNYFYYDRLILPRGLLARFVPTKSGVYRITSRNESTSGVEGWIFDENRETLLTYEHNERMLTDDGEVSMLYYMEAGKPYYIDIAFWDLYELGYIYYDITYEGAKLEPFRLCSPGYFTYDTDATGEAMYYTVSGGIKAVLGTDGYYHEDLGKDANGNQRYGSIIYADFTGLTNLFDSPLAPTNTYNADGTVRVDAEGNPIMAKNLIDMGGFDFRKTENDLYILAFLEARNGDVEATRAYFKETQGADYDSFAETYQLEDVLAGRYHGKGEDLTEEIRTYLDKIITTGSEERRGCVAVDARLAEILQLLMDKYTFENVDQSWLKLCYYYDYLGPEA